MSNLCRGCLGRATAVIALAFAVLVGCGAGGSAGDGRARTAKVGVILPDSKSSIRWETADRRYLEEAFKTANIDYDIQNAQNDRTAFQTIADQMITNGVTVLMIVNLDSRTGKAVLDRAKLQGVATIDYDRLTLGGSALYHVSFDNTKVGQLQGEGLVSCLQDVNAKKPVIAELNGATTDNNSSQFKKGYDSVLGPKFSSGEYIKGPDESVPDWDNAQAATIFEHMLDQHPDIAGVLAANDGLGSAAITVMKQRKLARKVPVTGQDATIQGLQNILTGDQCMTVYKAIRREADAAAQLAISLIRGEQRKTEQAVVDPTNHRNVPSVLLDPVAINKNNVRDVVADGFITKAELCTGELVTKCAEAGIT